VDLSRSHVSDVGLSDFKDLKNLRDLRLNHTKVSDDGLSHLQQLPHLMRLDVIQTAVSEAAVRKFRESHPRMLVNR
jgi:hypothetical protein